MGKFFVFFLFWTACLFQVETLTKFRISGTVTCAYNKNFRYEVVPWEWDTFFSNAIGGMNTGDGRGSGNFRVEGQEDNDGWWIVNWFDRSVQQDL
ncbi:unnamed protein product [Caenorhabditis nigoni]